MAGLRSEFLGSMADKGFSAPERTLDSSATADSGETYTEIDWSRRRAGWSAEFKR